MTDPSETPVPPASRSVGGRAQIVGTGLIGGSIGAGLRRRGWLVSGYDLDPARSARAVEIGAADRAGWDPHATLAFVATPAGAVAASALEALRALPGAAVTDVAGVKAPVVGAVRDPRFVGGHPMAGSEQEGVEGSDPDMFEGATWVLTPEPHTDAGAYSTVRAAVASLGANVVEITAGHHDKLVALVSHVPHLTAATLMWLADETASEHATLLRLAAGGFRDMTRIAAGEPSIWPDVCAENREAILAVVDRLQSALSGVRDIVAAGDRDGLLRILERARRARINLPAGVAPTSDAVEVRVPLMDRPGSLAGVTTLLGQMGVNIYDFEIAHSVEGDRGVLVLVCDGGERERVRRALQDHGYRCSLRPLGS